VLAGEISKYVCGIGLDPYYGFYHKSHTGFQPLVYDLMEPFRCPVTESEKEKFNEKIRLACKNNLSHISFLLE